MASQTPPPCASLSPIDLAIAQLSELQVHMALHERGHESAIAEVAPALGTARRPSASTAAQAAHGFAAGGGPLRALARSPQSARPASGSARIWLRGARAGAALTDPDLKSLDFGIAPDEQVIHISQADVARIPVEDRDHWADHAVEQPSSRMFLQMRMSPGSCFDDGDVRNWR